MKLTKRGKQARALLILAGLLLTYKGAQFALTHHQITKNCRNVAEGYVCDTGWEKNRQTLLIAPSLGQARL